MKTREEIEKLAENQIPYSGDIKFAEITQTKRVFYGKGYTQCQQDMADDLEAILNNSIYIDFISKKKILKYLKSLNKQD